MFIAVINENFSVAEESKKVEQASNYWATYQPQGERFTWMRRFNPYRWVKPNPVKVKVENMPSKLVLPMEKTLVQDYSAPRQEARPVPVRHPAIWMMRHRTIPYSTGRFVGGQ